MFRIVCIFTFLSTFLGYSQSYIGFDADNFNGIHGAIFNPANIADSRTKIDINIVSTSFFTVNNYLEVNYWKFITDLGRSENQFNQDLDLRRLRLDKKLNGAINSDTFGPSVLVTINEKHAVGLYTRARALVNINTLDEKLVNFFDEEITKENPAPLQLVDVNSNIVANSFAELGLTYARVLKNDRKEFLKGGISLKYIRGFASANAKITDGVVVYNPDNPNNEVLLNGTTEYSFSGNFDKNNNGQVGQGDDNQVGNFRGLGIDLGIVYEYRPNFRQNISRDNVKEQKVIRHITTYKYKVGVSLLDIGRINYRNQKKKVYEGTNVSRDEFLETNSFNNLESIFNPSNSTEDLGLWLPARLRGEFDLKLYKKFFLNAATQLAITGKNTIKANRYINQITVSPRYETKWFTMQLPITATQYGGVQVGLGGRLGPLFIGTSGLLSRTFDRKTRVFDFYAGLKIPIYHKTPEPILKSHSEDEAKRSNCIEGCPPVKKDKKKRLGTYKGKFDGKS